MSCRSKGSVQSVNVASAYVDVYHICAGSQMPMPSLVEAHTRHVLNRGRSEEEKSCGIMISNLQQLLPALYVMMLVAQKGNCVKPMAPCSEYFYWS